MSTSTLTSKGQTTIPKDIRKRLNLHPGDRLECVIDEDGRVLVLARLMAGQWSSTALAYSAEVASTRKAGQPWSHSYLRRNPPKRQRRRVEKSAISPKWDGKPAERIVEHLEQVLAR